MQFMYDASFMQREEKKREEYLAMQEARGPVKLGHRQSDQTTTTHSDNKGQKSKSSYRPGIEYLPKQCLCRTGLFIVTYVVTKLSHERSFYF
jgi:hypothetical protein